MKKYEDIMNVAVVNFRQIWGNKERNLDRIKGYIKAAAKKGADIIVFPEVALNGYDNEEDKEWKDKMQVLTAETVPGPSSESVAELTKKYGVYAVFGMAELDPKDNKVYNSACVCGPEGVIGAYRKIHPALQEICWCSRGDEPFTFDTPWGPVGVGICYDSYSFHELARFYAAAGCRLYLNPTAIGGPVERMDWRDYYRVGLEDIVNSTGMYVASSNLTGTNDYDEETGGSAPNIRPLGSYFGGGSIILGPGIGEKIHTYAGEYEYKEEELIMATVDLSQAHHSIYKVDPLKMCPDYRPDVYIKMNEKLLEMDYWKQFSNK